MDMRKSMAHIRTMKSIADRIVDAYKALGISQAEAARRCNMSAQRFGNYVNGKRRPDIQALVTIASALQTTPDNLLGVTGAAVDQELTDILGKLLELEGLDPVRAHTIAQDAAAAHQLLKALPEEGDEKLRRSLASQAVWTARRIK